VTAVEPVTPSSVSAAVPQPAPVRVPAVNPGAQHAPAKAGAAMPAKNPDKPAAAHTSDIGF